MRRKDWKIIFTALAFVAVIGKKKSMNGIELKQDVLRLAELVDEFCAAHVGSTAAFVSDDADAVLMDEMIEKHLRELRDEGVTHLPEDRQLLIKLHDRLRTRKARRRDRDFYGFASEDSMADSVLEFLDDELDTGNARLA